MSAMTSERQRRRDARAARREALSGAGPVSEERDPERFPGATAKFSLFGEVMVTGLVVAIAGVLVVTLPAALAAATLHLGRVIRAEGSSMHLFWRDLRQALPGGVAVGTAASVLAAVLAADIVLARSGNLPGGVAIGVVGWAGLVALGVAVLRTAALWRRETGWLFALRQLPGDMRRDMISAGYLAAAVVMVGVLTWALPPLIIPALGCAALAAVAVPHRRTPR